MACNSGVFSSSTLHEAWLTQGSRKKTCVKQILLAGTNCALGGSYDCVVMWLMVIMSVSIFNAHIRQSQSLDLNLPVPSPGSVLSCLSL